MYRFALYGRSECGKTCLLATLAMGAEGHPRGLTVERVPVVETSRHQDEVGSHELKALRAGRDWVDAAVAQLRKGSVPEGNPPLFDGGGMIVDFNMGSPRRGEIEVRTVDYSGELIAPHEEDRMDNAASLLREFLTQYDGFLILAETPHPDGRHHDHLSDDLQRLRQAFVSLRRSGGHVDTPVAVVFTKWDRLHAISPEAPDAEIENLRAFLQSHRSHASLVQSISNALAESASETVGESSDEPSFSASEWSQEDSLVAAGSSESSEATGQTGGLMHGNCAVFPASAFGQAEQHGTVERPAGTQPPFGLLEPFLWLADRRDAIDVSHLICDFRRNSEWHYWSHPGELNAIRYRCHDLRRQVAGNSEAGRQLANLASHLTWKWRRQVTAYVLSPIVLTCVVWLLNCRHTFQSKQAIVENPQSSEAHLLAARAWFDEYRIQPWPLWGLDSPTSARALVDQIDERVENLYWSRIEQAADDEQKYLAARAYLERLKNGLHVDIARQTVTEHEIENARHENDEWLAARTADSDRSGEAESELKRLSDAMASGLPHSDESTPEQRTAWTRLFNEVSQRLALVMRRKQWEVFLVRLDAQVTSFQLRPAAQLLVSWEHRDENWHTVTKEFGERVLERVRPEVDRRLREAEFESARNLVTETSEAWRLLETALREKLPELADGLHEARLDLAPLTARVAELHDRDLYDRVRRLKTAAYCRRYVDGAPLGVMRKEVETFDKWLSACAKPLTVKVVVHIFWSEKYGTFTGSTEDDHQLTILVDDVQTLLKPGLTGMPGRLSGEVGTFLLKDRTLEDRLRIRAELIEVDTIPYFNDDVGSGAFSPRLRELRDGLSLTINPADGSAFDNEVRFKITEGVPVEPELPPWKNHSSSR